VIQLTPEFKREILYYHAYTLDKKSSQEQFNQALLMEAVKAWNYFLDFSACPPRPRRPMLFARKRLADLEKTGQEVIRKYIAADTFFAYTYRYLFIIVDAGHVNPVLHKFHS